MKNLLVALFVGFISITTINTILTPAAHAAAADCEDKRFLGTMPAWYKGVAKTSADGGCEISIDNAPGNNKAMGGKLGSFLLVIAFNIIEIMMNIVAYVSVAFVIVGGFKYLTSNGSSDGNAKSRKTIINAVIGLILSILAIGIVNFITANL